jgi:anti-sigma regulatory factor (Ser/Thr protein kinase)
MSRVQQSLGREGRDVALDVEQLQTGLAHRVAGHAGPARTPALGEVPVPVLPSHEQQGTRMADDWPLRSYLELGALPSAVSCLRLHAKEIVWEWGLTELSENVELLVSELATNALQASQVMRWSQTIRLWLLSDKERVLILVWDASRVPPARIEAGEETESGRGLLLVEALSERWGSYAHPGLGGKIVWCEVSCTSDPGVLYRDRQEEY